VLETALHLRPDSARISALLGSTYLRAGSPEKAVAALEKAVASGGNDSRLYYLLVEAFQATHREADALKFAGDAVRLFSTEAHAQLVMAQQLVRVGRYNDAAPFFEKASALAPKDAEPVMGLAEVLQKKGDGEASLAAYRKALTLTPDDLNAQLGIARNLVLLRRFGEAKDVLDHALRKRPESAALHFELAKVYARLGDSGNAAEQTRIFQQLREQEASDPSPAATARPK
jgi:tetratricopeptide (TPR) repeat protein